MPGYRAKQLARITDAVAAARLEMRRLGRFDPLLFAEVYVRNGGIQIPGQTDEAAGAALGEALLAALRAGRGTSEDPHLRRELQRAFQEAEWTRLSESDRVVGFRVRLSPQAQDNPACEDLIKHSHGLGAGVFRKHEIAVLRPECADGCGFTPVYADDLEC